MKRRNLSILTQSIVSQLLPIDYEEKLATFRAYCKNKITEKKIEPEHFAFDIPVNTTGENRDQDGVCTQHREREVIPHCSSWLPG